MSKKYNTATYSSLSNFFYAADKVAAKKRKEMVYSAIDLNQEVSIDLMCVTSILDVGTTSDESLSSSNIILEIPAPGKRVTSLSDQAVDANWKSISYINEYILGDITQVEFSASGYDLVICSAVLEHCGSKERQVQAIKNLLGAADKYLLLTVPNRWYPIELHSKLPLIHYLPKNLCRFLYRLFGFKELASESNLNYISHSSILNEIRNFDPSLQIRVEKIWTFGFCSNYLFIVKSCSSDFQD
jgi:hypothetical protein